MTFERPAFLFALLLAGLPAALYLSRYVRSTRAHFPAVYYMFGDDRRPLARLRSRQIATTLVRMALVVLAALAFAGPVSGTRSQPAASAGARRTVLVVDVSASLAAGGEPTLLAQARAAARARVEAADAGRLFAVVPCPGAARRLQWLSRDQALARVDNLGQAWERCAPADLLERLLPSLHRETRVVIVSDLALPPEEGHRLARQTREAGIEWVRVGEAGWNLGLEALTVAGAGVRALVRNFDSQPREAQIALTCDGRADGEAAAKPRTQRITVPPRATVPVTFDGRPPLPGGECSVGLAADGLQADNRLHFAVVEKRRVQVVLVEGTPSDSPGRSPSFFVGAAMRAAAASVNVVRLAQPEFSYDTLAVADILVLIDPQPLPDYLERALFEFVHGGGTVWLFAGANMSRWQPENHFLPGAQFRPCVTVPEHPFRLEWVHPEDPALTDLAAAPASAVRSWHHLRHVAPFFTKRTSQVLARFTDSVPAVLRLPAARGEVIIWALVPEADNGNFAWHPLFPLTIGSALRSILPDGVAVRVPVLCDVQKRCRLPAAAGDELLGREGTSDRLAASARGEVTCRRPGPYYRTDRGGRVLAVECRLPAAERSHTPLGVASLAAAQPAATPAAPPARTRHWGGWLMAAVTLLVFLELWLISGGRNS